MISGQGGARLNRGLPTATVELMPVICSMLRFQIITSPSSAQEHTPTGRLLRVSR